MDILNLSIGFTSSNTTIRTLFHVKGDLTKI